MRMLELTERDADLDILGFSKVLRRAAELVEQGWCQMESALDAQGHPVVWDSPLATQFCEMGATHRAGMELGFSFTTEDFLLLLTLSGYKTPIPRCTPAGIVSDWEFGGMFNDIPGRTAEEVAAHLRQGADRLEQIRTIP